jgi:hypothetical protein
MEVWHVRGRPSRRTVTCVAHGVALPVFATLCGIATERPHASFVCPGRLPDLCDLRLARFEFEVSGYHLAKPVVRYRLGSGD